MNNVSLQNNNIYAVSRTPGTGKVLTLPGSIIDSIPKQIVFNYVFCLLL